MSTAHGLKDLVPNVAIKGKVLERTSSFKLLGIWINEHLKWTDHIKYLSSSCYAVLSTLRKLNNLAPLNVRKQLAESLVLSKLGYNDIVFHPLPQYQQKKLQRIQNAAASFVLNKYTTESDAVEHLKWLPVKQRTEYHLLRLGHKSLWDPSFPDYLKLEKRKVHRQLRSSCATNLVIPLETGTFQDNCSKIFNELPTITKNDSDFKSFTTQVYKTLMNKAKQRLQIP